MSEDERSEWTRARAGDTHAFAAVFDRYESRAFAHARQLLTSREDAKDAVTVAFYELWRKRAQVRLVEGSPLPWLLNTVAFTARNLERSSRRYRGLLHRLPPPAPSGPVVAVDESGALAALKRLPSREQSVMVLTVLEGYPERDVARALGIPVGTVKSRLNRAKARLRTELEGMEFL